MNPLTLEWINKAEGDFITARRELRARVFPNYDATCFHSQQMAEKYLKAFLQENGTPVPHTHNLIDLLAICSGINATMVMMRSDLVRLDRYAVRFRYPGDTAEKEEAKLAFRAAVSFRLFMRARLGLA